MEQEKMLRELERDTGLPLTIIRPAPIYGPRHRYGVYHIPLLLSKLGFAPVLRMYPRRKEPRFPSVHVEDLVDAAVFLHKNKEEAIGETFNILGNCIGQDELLEFVANEMGVEKKRIPIPISLYIGVLAFIF